MSKICTSIEQSKKLIELGIDVTTADMHYMYRHWEIDEDTVGSQSDTSIGFDSDFYYGVDNGKTYHYIPAWSLAALLDYIKDKCGYFELVYLSSMFDGRANKLENVYRLSTDVYDVYKKEAVDACYEMIIKLHEQKLL